MAIKVGGTTVVDDTRALTNIASIDATPLHVKNHMIKSINQTHSDICSCPNC